MLLINKDGSITNPRIKLWHYQLPKLDGARGRSSISGNLERGTGNLKVRGIIVHQTDTETASQTFGSYTNQEANGAHFLIDKDGTIYQTASVHHVTQHVGKLRARCLLEKTCTPTEFPTLLKWAAARNAQRTYEHEKNKKNMPYGTIPEPDNSYRFPKNEDSIGIEIVGKSYKYAKDGTTKLANQSAELNKKKGEKIIYDPLTTEQKTSLAWLLMEIASTLRVPLTEIFRHPDVAWKEPSEAETAEPIIQELRDAAQ